MAMKEYTILSLFSGCGGLDLGFQGDFEVPQKRERVIIIVTQKEVLPQFEFEHISKLIIILLLARQYRI